MSWMEWSSIGAAFAVAVLIPALCFAAVMQYLRRIERTLAQATKAPTLADESIEQLERVVMTLRMTLRDVELRIREESSRKPQSKSPPETRQESELADFEPHLIAESGGKQREGKTRKAARSESTDEWGEAIKALEDLANAK